MNRQVGQGRGKMAKGVKERGGNSRERQRDKPRDKGPRQRGKNNQEKKQAEFEQTMKQSHEAPTERSERLRTHSEPRKTKKSAGGVRTGRDRHGKSGGTKKRVGGGKKGRGGGGSRSKGCAKSFKTGGHGGGAKGKGGSKSESSSSSASSGKCDSQHESGDSTERDDASGRWQCIVMK